MSRSLTCPTAAESIRSPVLGQAMVNMKIYISKISKEVLERVPADECAIFLSLAHLSNEIIGLEKLVLWSYDLSSDNKAIANGQVTLSLMLIKLLSGKLKEGYKLIKNKYYSTEFSREYEKILSNKHKDTLDLLKRYFSKRNIIDNVRNNYAFHYTPDGLRAALPNINEDLLLYIEESGKVRIPVHVDQ
jgi:hypothetical protein